MSGLAVISFPFPSKTLKFTSATYMLFWAVISLTTALFDSSILAGFVLSALLLCLFSSFWVSFFCGSSFFASSIFIFIISLTTSSSDFCVFFAEALTYKTPAFSPAEKTPIESIVPSLVFCVQFSSAKS